MMRVQDFNGKEIKVGTKIQFGSPAEGDDLAMYRGEVTEISEPEITFHEDEFGRDQADGYYVTLTMKFEDGSTETTRASIISVWGDYALEETFEEGGDLEVV
jgi:hypothetical protein